MDQYFKDLAGDHTKVGGSDSQEPEGHDPAAGSSTGLAGSSTDVMKKPAGSTGVPMKKPAGSTGVPMKTKAMKRPAAASEEQEQGRDVVKARKMRDMWDLIPEAVRTEVEQVP